MCYTKQPLIILYLPFLDGTNILPKMNEEVEWSDGEGKCIHVKWSKIDSKFFDSKSYKAASNCGQPHKPLTFVIVPPH
jgi:hypothetical protein